jgi:hypothetical protein
MSEEILSGGNVGGAVRAGDTVRRTGGAWTPTVQRLLHHLRDQGLTWVPEPFGTDDAGRDTVSYLPGIVLNTDLPDWVWADDVLTDPANTEAVDNGITERVRRLRLLCTAYGPHAPHPGDVVRVAVDRLTDLAAFTEALGPHLAGHVALYRRDARWITAHTTELGSR